MYTLIKQCNSGWKMTLFTAKLVSNKPCFYHDTFFATRTRVPGKNEKSVMLPDLSVLMRRSMLRLLATGDIGMSWLLWLTSTDNRVSASDAVSRL